MDATEPTMPRGLQPATAKPEAWVAFSMRTLWVCLLLLGVGLTGCADSEPMTVTSPAFEPGGSIPQQFSCDGNETSPPIVFADLPQGTATVALVMEDLDATDGEESYVHWLVWNVPASGGSASIPEASVPREAVQGTNSAGEVGYAGPCPPSQDGAHTYDLVGYALDRSLSLEEGADRDGLEQAMRGYELGQGRLSVTYER